MGTLFGTDLTLAPDAPASEVQRVAEAKGLKFYAGETAKTPFYVISHRCMRTVLSRGDLDTVRKFVQNYGTC